MRVYGYIRDSRGKLTITGLNGEELVSMNKYKMNRYYVNLAGNGYHNFRGWCYDAEDTNVCFGMDMDFLHHIFEKQIKEKGWINKRNLFPILKCGMLTA